MQHSHDNPAASIAPSPQAPSLQVARVEAARLVASLDEQAALAGHEVAKVFQQALQVLEAAGAGEDEVWPLIYEVRLWFSRPHEVFARQREDDNVALSERFGEWSRASEFLPPAAVARFQERLGVVQNPFLIARYADFLAVRAEAEGDNSQARQRVQQAVPAYLESVPPLAAARQTLRHIEAIHSLDSAAHLGVCKAHNLMPTVVKALREQLEILVLATTRRFKGEDESTDKAEADPDEEGEEQEDFAVPHGRWAVDVGWILLNVRARMSNAVPDADLEWWQEQAKEMARQNNALGDALWEQIFLSQAAEAASLRGESREQLHLLRLQARAKQSEARARTQGPGASLLAAASIMEEAVDLLERPRSKSTDEAERAAIAEEVRGLKLEIRRFYREGESELGVVSTTFDIPRQAIEDAIAPILGPLDLAECLQRLGASLLPDPLEAERWADAQANTSSLSSILPRSVMSEGMEIRSYSSDEERRQFEFNRSLDWQIQLHSSLLLPPIWRRLREEKGLTPALLLGYLDAWGFIEEERRPLIERGIEQYFTEDFASSLHLLVPQLEHVIRLLFERAGLPPARPARGGGWEFESFGGLLRRIDKELPGVLPRELRLYVERTLCDITGWNLRNRIAHGLMTKAECTRARAETVLHIYLSFSLFNEISERSSHEPSANPL